MSPDRRNSFAYLRERIVNAWWMIREGRFRLFVASAWQELAQRLTGLREGQQALPREYSTNLNPCRLQPPSSRPTRYRLNEGDSEVPARSGELRQVLVGLSGSQTQPGQGE